MNQKYRTLITYNLDKLENIELDHTTDMPIIHKEKVIPKDLTGFNYANKYKNKCVGIHFYLDDYQFERVWNHPENYINMFKQYECILTPDFSLYRDMPIPMQIWNTYRNRFLGQYYQKQGIKVIPTISWGNEKTYSFCFTGIEKNSIVSLSTLGVKKDKKALALWKKGVDEMIKQIHPSKILIYGSKIEYDFKNIEVIYYKNKIEERFNNLKEKI